MGAASRVHALLLSHKVKEFARRMCVEIQGVRSKPWDKFNSLRSLPNFCSPSEFVDILRNVMFETLMITYEAIKLGK